MLALLLNMHSIIGIYLFMNLCDYLFCYLLIANPFCTYCVFILLYKSNINRTHCFFSPLCDVQCFLHRAPEGQNVSFFFFLKKLSHNSHICSLYLFSTYNWSYQQRWTGKFRQASYFQNSNSHQKDDHAIGCYFHSF